MADVIEPATYENAAQAISQGKRHLLVRDNSLAVAALAQGCGLLAAQHGEMADELGEPFLLYGRALLCLSREEAGVLGSGVPGTEDEDDGDDDGEEDGDGEVDEEDEGAEKDKEDADKEAKSTDKETGEPTVNEKTEERKSEEKSEPSSSSSVQNDETAAGPSKRSNGVASTSTLHQNGDVHENGDDHDDDDDENEDDDDANSNLQLAWEVLELSKLILLKRGPPGWKLLAEAHRLLGEVAMESGNQPGALTDLNACLDLLRKIEPADARTMAETHYQLGLAHSLGNEFDASIEQFQEATILLETRIKELEAITDPPESNDPFYSIASEIKELKELLPEIQEKITDMRDFKQQACKLVIEGIKSRVASGSCSNGAGPSGETAGASSSSGSSSSSSANAANAAAASKEIKPASDISHLVRKKRKTEEDGDTELMASPCKKPTPEKSA